ncbi:MAG: T9SS type A sorting domain-containing protein [Flavobacteriaceae bacterium]|nr:T9SS type A sorting domain-containing protein [Flavobacteriaceae bacterium]
MNKITLVLFFLIFSGAFSQVTNQGEPLSWKLNHTRSVSPLVLEEIDLQSLIAEDLINDARGDIPWRFGKEIEVSFNMSNSGVWDEMNNGDRIWRINIQSLGANTMNFIFDDFYLPPGANLYLYNDDRSDLLGAYTSSQNRDDRQLGTWFVDGDNVWIEYFEPRSQRNKGSLNISKVVHGYRSIPQNFSNRGLNDSGPCNLDVDCSIGSDFDNIKDVLKRSVALILAGGSLCSGTLINNTDNNNAPYFLTANHCNNGNTGAWSFRFNWVSPNPVCAQNQNSSNGSTNHTVSGASVLATNSKSDFMLVNIDAELPSAWNLTWAGWNRSTTDVPEFTIGIHHPAGDIMKVCRDDDAPTKQTFNFGGNPSAQMWRVGNWELGVTEGGSSGSALFDQEGRIVGQLAGGSAACSGTSNNGGFDIYGRFDTSWDFGTTNNARLSNWLDPSGTGATSIDILNAPDFQFIGNISIYPNPTSDLIYIMNNNSSQLNFELYSVNGQQMKAANLPFINNSIDVSGFAEGVYFLKLFDGITNNSLVKRIVVKR